MTRKRKGLIALMALSLTAGVGSALALTVTPATGAIERNVDGAVYFNWDQEKITSISDLKGGIAQYTSFSASVESTKSVTGTVTISFTLSAETTQAGKTAVLTGLTISVYETAGIIDSQHTAETLINGKDALFTLKSGQLTNNATFTVSAAAAKHTTTQAYVLKFLYDGSQLGANDVLDGKVTLNSSFATTQQ